MIQQKYEIFISHSSKDRALAEAVVRAFENAGYTCWISPRDIPYGVDYPTAIMEGISQCEIFLLLVTPNSVNSKDVRNELDNAHRKNKRLVPVLIDNIQLPDVFNYYLSLPQQIRLRRNEISKLPKILFADESTKFDKKSKVQNINAGIHGEVNTYNSSVGNIMPPVAPPPHPPILRKKSYTGVWVTITIVAVIVFLGLCAFMAFVIADEEDYGVESTPDTVEEVLNKGIELYNDSLYVEAFPYLESAAKEGDRVAQNQLGLMYLRGEGVDQDLTEAKHWFEKSANQNCPAAQYNLGYMNEINAENSEDSEECLRYYLEAKDWYRKAAENGVKDAEEGYDRISAILE